MSAYIRRLILLTLRGIIALQVNVNPRYFNNITLLHTNRIRSDCSRINTRFMNSRELASLFRFDSFEITLPDKVFASSLLTLYLVLTNEKIYGSIWLPIVSIENSR
jgi:hypothetical protein